MAILVVICCLAMRNVAEDSAPPPSRIGPRRPPGERSAEASPEATEGHPGLSAREPSWRR
jgi:hypothetical protein